VETKVETMAVVETTTHKEFDRLSI